MDRFKRYVSSLKTMGPAPRLILLYALAVSCALLLAALGILLATGAFSRATYDAYRTVRALYDMPPGFLLLAGVAACCVPR